MGKRDTSANFLICFYIFFWPCNFSFLRFIGSHALSIASLTQDRVVGVMLRFRRSFSLSLSLSTSTIIEVCFFIILTASHEINTFFFSFYFSSIETVFLLRLLFVHFILSIRKDIISLACGRPCEEVFQSKFLSLINKKNVSCSMESYVIMLAE